MAGAIDAHGAIDDGTVEPTPPSPRRAWFDRHPSATTALLVLPLAVLYGVWIWHSRRLGAYDPDEAGYIANALRYHRSLDPSHPFELVRQLRDTGTGPLVPFLSVPLLVAGPRDPRTVLLIQPILAIVTAVAAAGITRRLTGRLVGNRAGWLVAGFVMALPTVALATQSYWLGLGTAAAMACGIWALLASDRLTNRWTWVYGVSMGLMVLARVMAIAFVPAMLVAGLVIAWPVRRSLIRLGLATLLGAVVGAPWWIANRESVFDYLLGYGYGPRAGLFGSGGPLKRVATRLYQFGSSAVVWWPVALLAVALLGIGIVRMVRAGWFARPWSTEARALIAVAAAVAVGLAALMTSTNSGVWFELPLVMVGLPAMAAVAVHLPLTLRRVVTGGVVIAIVALPVGLRLLDVRHFDGAFEQYDARFDPDDRSAADEAADDWWRLSTDVAAELRRLSDGGRGATIDVSGNSELFNSNTLQLAAELASWPATIWVPDTTASTAERQASLDPDSIATLPDGSFAERIIVVARRDQKMFTPDRDVERFAGEARDAGWREVASFDMPGEGEVTILRHESAIDDG